MGEWLTVREAARLAGVDSDTIRRWCDRGMIPSMRTPGGHRRVESEGLVEVMRAPKTKPTDAPRRSVPDALDAMIVEADSWWDWTPPQYLSEDQLAQMRLTIVGPAGVISSLNQLADAITDRLNELDSRPESPTT